MSDRPTLLLVEPRRPFRPGMVWIAETMGRSGRARVALCSWDQLTLAGEAVLASGPMLIAEGGTTRLVEGLEPLRAGAVHYRAEAASSPFPRGAEEVEAAARLERAGVRVRHRDRNGVVDRLLAAASLQGVVTNSALHEAQWNLKDRMELTLRAHARATGRGIDRAETMVVRPRHLRWAVARMRGGGPGCILKPAGGYGGLGITVLGPGDPVPVGRYRRRLVVQRLLQDPLLVGGRKVDVRTHLIIDVDHRERSGMVEPILLRRAPVRHRPYEHLAEVLNIHTVGPGGLAPEIAPLEQSEAVSDRLREAIRETCAKVVGEVADAHDWWLRRRRELGFTDIPNRVLIIGVDLLLQGDGEGGVRALLSELNIRVQLRRDLPACDLATEDLLSGPLLETMIRPRL